MSYTRGIILSGETYCFSCVPDLTEEEVRYIQHGCDDPYERIMTRWPLRDRYGAYQRDEEGTILFAEQVRLPSRVKIYDETGQEPVGIITDDDFDVEGCLCDGCGKEIIEPYTATCVLCSKPAFYAQAALDAEKLFDFSRIVCLACVENQLAAIRAALTMEIKKAVAALSQQCHEPEQSLFKGQATLDMLPQQALYLSCLPLVQGNLVSLSTTVRALSQKVQQQAWQQQHTDALVVYPALERMVYTVFVSWEQANVPVQVEDLEAMKSHHTKRISSF